MHIERAGFINFGMFREEIKSKLGAVGELLPFTVCMLSATKLVVSGVKSVMSASSGAIALKLGSESLVVSGDDLRIVEIGGGDIYIVGRIGGLNFEEKK